MKGPIIGIDMAKDMFGIYMEGGECQVGKRTWLSRENDPKTAVVCREIGKSFWKHVRFIHFDNCGAVETLTKWVKNRETRFPLTMNILAEYHFKPPVLGWSFHHESVLYYSRSVPYQMTIPFVKQGDSI